jgi:hypothetical protein
MQSAPPAGPSVAPPLAAAPPSVQLATAITNPASAETHVVNPAAHAPTVAVSARDLGDRDEPTGMDIDLARPLFTVAAVGAIAALCALIAVDRTRGAGVAVGAVLATANLWVFARIGSAVMRRPGEGLGWVLIAPLKLGLLFAAVVALLKSQLASPIDFLIGYLALPIGIVLAQLIGRRSPFDRQQSTF